MKQLAALILAKSGSKRLPQKNTKDFHGKPMFLVNVEKCLKLFEKVYVSSDDDWILHQAVLSGALPIRRTEELCGDVPNIPCYQHAMTKMKDSDGIVAVQANSPTVESNLIALTKQLMETGVSEVMTCNEGYYIYGSIWAITKEKLTTYNDFYNPKPDVLLVDTSVDIHTQEDLEKALCQQSIHQ